jgi:cell wall-associated NlpC family hydrolase
MVGLKTIIIGTLLLICTTTLGQNKVENGIKDVLTSDTVLNKFMTYWLRKPYKFGGSTEKGIDCSQFNKRLYKDVYGKELTGTAEEQWFQTKRVKKDSLKVGDLIFFRSRQSPSGWHCGTYIGNTYFIHAANKYEGVKISSLNEPRYTKSIKGFGRLENNKL